MKKIMALILSFAMLLTLCACGKVSGEKAIGNYFDLTANPDKKLVEDSFPAQVLEYIEAKYDMETFELFKVGGNWYTLNAVEIIPVFY